MSGARIGRPSPAMAVALIALFVALGGSGYAAVKINGKNIVNRSLAGIKVKRNTLGGAEIRESRLGRVRSATSASLLAGRGPSAFLAAGGKAADSDRLDGRDSAAFLGADAKATDSDRLDGKDSAGFLGAEAKAVDSDKLDGIDSTGFVAAGSAGAGMQTARIDGLSSVAPGVQERFGAISGVSSAVADVNAVTMISPPVAVVARDLAVRFTTGVLGGNRVVTLVVNGTDSQLSCMAAPQGAPAETCSDTQSNVSVPSGSTLALKVRTSALNPFTVPATDAMVTWRTTNP